MTWKLFLVAMFGLVGCAVIVPLGGCDGGTTQTKPTIDTSTPFKTPETPTTHKVEVAPKK
jgi:hypothetical protein